MELKKKLTFLKTMKPNETNPINPTRTDLIQFVRNRKEASQDLPILPDQDRNNRPR